MRSLITAILLSASMFACTPGQSEEAVETPAVAQTADVPEAAPAVGEMASKADEPAETKEEAEQSEPEGFLGKVLEVVKSLETLVGAIAGLLIALGVAAPFVVKLLKAREALNTVAHKIEQNKKKHKTATDSLVEDIKTAAPKGTKLGAVVHKAAKEAERRVKNGA